MLPYFIALFLSIVIFNIAHSFKFNSFATYCCYALSAIPLLIITSFKNVTVGVDTVTYVYYFKQLRNFNQLWEVTDGIGEIGFWSLNVLGHFFTHNYFIIFLFVSIIISGCYLYSIKTFKLGTLSFITLLLVGPFFFQLNGTRQAITIAIFCVSVSFIIKKQPARYFLSVFLGFLFHKSMILCLPIYFIFIGEIKPRRIAAIIFCFIIFLIFFQSFIGAASSLDSRYSSYGQRQEKTGGVVVSLFNLFLLGWFVLARKLNPHILANKVFDTLLVLYLLGCLIGILSLVLGINPSGFLRLSVYFIQMNMFLLPMSIYSFRDEQTRYLLILGSIVLMSLYFYMTTAAFSHAFKFNPAIERLYEN